MPQRLPKHKMDTSMFKENNSPRVDPRSIRSSRRWYEYARAMRRKYPLCMSPIHNENIYTPSDCVHHIVPLAADPSLAFVESNTIPLCQECHDKIEEMNRKEVQIEMFNNWQNKYGEMKDGYQECN